MARSPVVLHAESEEVVPRADVDRHPSHALRVAAGGALAGAVNAWLCFAGIPVDLESEFVAFRWHLIPAGAVHGSILATAGLLGWRWSRRVDWPRRLTAALMAGWVGGYLAWQALSLSVDQRWAPARWPFDEGVLSWVVSPLQVFGLVTFVYVALLDLWVRSRISRRVHVLAALVAGVSGSLWWWIEMGHWYYSPIHGAIWGIGVGLACWSANARPGGAGPQPAPGVGS